MASAQTEYEEKHKASLEAALGIAISATFAERPANPLAYIASILQRRSISHEPSSSTQQPPGRARLKLPPLQEEATGDWSLGSWLQGLGTHRVVAAAIVKQLAQKATSAEDAAALEHQATPSDDDATALAFLRGLTSRAEVALMLRTDAAIETQIDVVWDAVGMLQQAGAATNKEVEGKFADAIGMEYKGLDAYFGGLEGVVGGPSRKIREGMAAEHVSGSESYKSFTTGNYGVRTTSKAEWLFVTDDDEAAALAQLGLESWPAESEEKLPDRSHCRKRRSLADVKRAADQGYDGRSGFCQSPNARLVKDGHAALIVEELIAAIMYTGPMFVKYNAVLRGVESTAPFLRNTMVSLCCPKATADAYLGTAKMFEEPSDGTVTFDEAKKSLNKYATTLHGINSAVIKLGKLTVATKVYRGVSGMKLPDTFWTANEFGVKGGVENGFMSTTLDRGVAMGYAKGDGSRPGIVIEAKQGMVNRGAEISWLSQYPHEEEILFGPLTGLEVLATRIEGSLVVVECGFSVNLTALTLEQVLNKRHKLVREMAGGIVLDVRSELAGVAGVDEAKQAEWVRDHMDEKVLQQAPEHFNDDARFVQAVEKALELKKAATGKELLKVVMGLEPAALAEYRGLLVYLLEHSNEEVRIEAVETLGKLEPAALAQHGAALAAKLEDSMHYVRKAAVQTLGKLEPAALAQHGAALAARLADSDSDVREAAVQTLGKLEPAALAQHGAALAAKLKDSNWQVRQAAVQTLGKLELAALVQYGAALAARLEDSDKDVREAAVETLGKLDLAALAQHGAALVARLADSSEGVRLAAVQTLGKLEPAALAQHGAALVARLADSDSDVREAAWEVVTKLGAEETLAQHAAVIVAKLEDSDVYVRKAAVDTMGKLELVALGQHQQSIAKAAKEDKNTEVQDAARFVMHKLEPAAGHMDAVVDRLEDSEWDVRKAAVKTLGKLEPAALAQHGAAVAARLKDSVEDVRKAAVETLGKLEPAALAQHGAAVAARLKDSEELVRQAAVQTLGRLEPAALAQHEQAIAKAAKKDKDSDVRRAAAVVLATLRAGK